MTTSPSLVFDCGSCWSKCGFGGDDAPRVVYPTTPVDDALPPPSPAPPSPSKAAYTAYTAEERRDRRAWEATERLWDALLFGELQCTTPEHHPVMAAESPLTTKHARERLTQLLLEAYNVASVCYTMDAVLALYASGRSTGVVLSCGHAAAHCVPVYEGHAIAHGVTHAPVAGDALTRRMMRLVSHERGGGGDATEALTFSHAVASERQMVCNMKERLCYIAQDCGAEEALYEALASPAASPCASPSPSQSSSQQHPETYELPDGRNIVIGVERFQCPEALFQPSLMTHVDGDSVLGMHELVHATVRRCDADVHASLWANIVLHGGTTLLPGFEARLSTELMAAVAPPANTSVRIDAPPERKYAAWIGGSILAELPVFHTLSVSKAEYDEFGPAFVHRKCV